MRIKVSPRFAHRLCAAGHGDRLQPRQPLVAKIVGEQELAAPYRAVIAKAESIEHDAERRRRMERSAVLSKAGGDMGVMVLNLNQRQGPCVGLCASEFRRQIFRMPVDDDRRRRVIEQAPIERQILFVII